MAIKNIMKNYKEANTTKATKFKPVNKKAFGSGFEAYVTNCAILQDKLFACSSIHEELEALIIECDALFSTMDLNAETLSVLDYEAFITDIIKNVGKMRQPLNDNGERLKGFRDAKKLEVNKLEAEEIKDEAKIEEINDVINALNNALNEGEISRGKAKDFGLLDVGKYKLALPSSAKNCKLYQANRPVKVSANIFRKWFEWTLCEHLKGEKGTSLKKQAWENVKSTAYEAGMTKEDFEALANTNNWKGYREALKELTR